MIIGTENSVQLYELFLCGGMGFLLGGCYDVFHLLRACVHNKIFTVAADIVFCLLSGLIGFLFCLAVTDGVLRVYVLVGFLVGFFAYRYTVGKWMVSPLVKLGKTVRRRICSSLRRMKTRIFCKKAEKPQKNTCSVQKDIV